MGIDRTKMKLLFVGGCPRSGTSVFQKMMGRHTSVWAGPEFDHSLKIAQLFDIMRKGTEETRRQELYYDTETLRAATRQFMWTTLTGGIKTDDVVYISEKTPANVLCFNFLASLFPDAKFAFVVRDPRAILASLLKVEQKAKEMGSEKRPPASLWAKVELIHSHLAAGDSFLGTHGERCQVVYYEDFVMNPGDKAKEVCEFLDLPFQSQMSDTAYQSALDDIARKNKSPYATSLLKGPVSTERVSKWQDELPVDNRYYVEDYFCRKPLSVLTRYKIERPYWKGRILTIPPRTLDLATRAAQQVLHVGRTILL